MLIVSYSERCIVLITGDAERFREEHVDQETMEVVEPRLAAPPRIYLHSPHANRAVHSNVLIAISILHVCGVI